MGNQHSDKDPGGQQPEFLKGLEAAAEADGMKPDDQVNQATSKTAPKPDSLEREEATAAGILRRNAEKDTGRST